MDNYCLVYFIFSLFSVINAVSGFFTFKPHSEIFQALVTNLNIKSVVIIDDNISSDLDILLFIKNYSSRNIYSSILTIDQLNSSLYEAYYHVPIDDTNSLEYL